MERKERKEDYIELRIKCKTTEMPTPCHLKRTLKLAENGVLSTGV